MLQLQNKSVEENLSHLEDPLEGVQVADLTLHDGTEDETTHNLEYDETRVKASRAGINRKQKATQAN